MTKLGGPKSQYYEACYQMAKVLLIKDDDKRKCVILHGRASSGKTWIARYTANIFQSHWKSEVKGIYDERLTPSEAHKQLLVINEANMHSLFSTKNISKMKTLTEGLGIPLENKYGHPFTGFIGARTLLTCNGLCCPFVEPSSSKSGFDAV